MKKEGIKIPQLRRCPYGCTFDPIKDQWHIENCRDANKA